MTRPGPGPTIASARLRQIRLGAGLVLFTYVATHLLNHALGLISLDAMQAGAVWFLRLWRNPLGTVALYGALILHALLALWFVYERRTLRSASQYGSKSHTAGNESPVSYSVCAAAATIEDSAGWLVVPASGPEAPSTALAPACQAAR